MKRLKLNFFLSAALNLFLVPSAFADKNLSADIQESVKYPLAVSDRPFTLPSGVAEIGGRMKVATTHDPVSLDVVNMTIGITDNLQLGTSWGGLNFPGLNPAKFVYGHIGYFLFANNFMASMMSFDAPLYFTGNVFRRISFAMPSAFPIVKGISLVAFYDSLIDIGFENKGVAASFNFPVSLSMQVTPRLSLDISTRLARFELGESSQSSFAWNAAPFRVKGLYAINSAFDVFAGTGFEDIYQAKNSFSFTLGAQFRIGSLS